MGPRYSSDGAVQYVHGPGRDQDRVRPVERPGHRPTSPPGPNALAAAKHVPIQDFTENVPITSADSIAIKLVNAAGANGAVVLNFTPPEALLILQAAQKLNLEDRVKYWACSTPCNTDFLATSLGPKWNNKLFVNAELTPLDRNTSPTAQLFDAILKQYGSDVSGGVGSFSEMGFVIGEARHARPGDHQGRRTRSPSVSAAFKALNSYNTGLLCQGFTYGNYSEHIPNNMDYTVTPDNGKFVVASTGGGCTLISADDPQIAAVPVHRRHSAFGQPAHFLINPQGLRLVTMPSWSEFQPFIVSGLALGGVYALSGVGLVVLYRATGVLNLAFGAVGAMGAFIAWSIINKAGAPGWVGWIACILFGGVVTLGYGHDLRARSWPGGARWSSPSATLGLALVLFGAMDLLWPSSGGQAPVDLAAHRQRRVHGRPGSRSTGRQVIALGAGHRHHRRHPRVPALHQAGHRDARDGQRPGDHRDARRPGPPGGGGRLVRLRTAGRHRRASCSPTSSALDDTTLTFMVTISVARRRADREAALHLGSPSPPRS